MRISFDLVLSWADICIEAYFEQAFLAHVVAHERLISSQKFASQQIARHAFSLDYHVGQNHARIRVASNMIVLATQIYVLCLGSTITVLTEGDDRDHLNGSDRRDRARTD